jgi:hypothetical protein
VAADRTLSGLLSWASSGPLPEGGAPGRSARRGRAYPVDVDPRIRTRIVTATLLALFALVIIGTLVKNVH